MIKINPFTFGKCPLSLWAGFFGYKMDKIVFLIDGFNLYHSLDKFIKDHNRS